MDFKKVFTLILSVLFFSPSYSNAMNGNKIKFHKGENDKCPICSQDFEDNDKIILDACGYYFHPSCIKEYGQNILENTGWLPCPMCKEQLKTKATCTFAELLAGFPGGSDTSYTGKLCCACEVIIGGTGGNDIITTTCGCNFHRICLRNIMLSDYNAGINMKQRNILIGRCGRKNECYVCKGSNPPNLPQILQMQLLLNVIKPESPEGKIAKSIQFFSPLENVNIMCPGCHQPLASRYIHKLLHKD